MITPAISVLSAVQGLEIATPSISSAVVPLTVGILVALFAVQRVGTAGVARFFGPIMTVWFVVLAALGAHQLVRHPGILRAVLPSYAVEFLVRHPATSFVALGAIVLAVTGAEALYADMGHFGRPAIRRAWFWLVFPALAINYLGQASLILERPATISNPLYLLTPSWGRMGMVVLATVATIIASQAVITGAFSLARQAVRMGFLPRLSIVHTSDVEMGQIFVPAINMVLLAGVVAIVLGFRTSQRLASAYGLAVTGTFVITTMLFLVIAHRGMGWSLRRTLVIGVPLLTVDVAFFAANVTKIASGGWLPLAIAIAAFTILTTWHRGAEIVRANRAKLAGSLQAYVGELDAMDPPLLRLPRTGVFLGADKQITPLALRTAVEHLHARHEAIVVLSVANEQRAHVPVAERIVIDGLRHPDDQIVHVTARYGYKDHVDVPAALQLAVTEGLALDVSDPSYYVSRITLKLTREPGMRTWRKRLFLALARNAGNPVEYFGLPDDRVVAIGGRVPV
jgi:KUP system potassium uptake protein